MAEEYPNVIFGHCSSDISGKNLCSYFGKMYQARYLAGIVAGMNTKNGKIGYVAAFPIPECIRGLNAFALGVQSVNPEATVEVIWTSTWFNPTTEKQAALELLNKGCDVIEQHQDTTAPQVAAQEKGALCLGYNVPTPNAAPKAYLTAPIFDWPVFYTSNVQAILDGTWEGKHYWLPVSTGIAKLDDLTPLNKAGTAEAVDKVYQKMLKDEFSLNELVRLYELILGKSISYKAFIQKMLDNGIIHQDNYENTISECITHYSFQSMNQMSCLKSLDNSSPYNLQDKTIFRFDEESYWTYKKNQDDYF